MTRLPSVCLLSLAFLAPIQPAAAGSWDRPVAPWTAEEEYNLRPAPIFPEENRADGTTGKMAQEKAAAQSRSAPASPPPPEEEDIGGKSAQEKDTPSPLEDMYAGRVIDAPRQFGYDLFGTVESAAPSPDNPSIPAGAAQDSLLLNFGDALEITLRGQTSSQKTYTVDNDGLLIVDDFPPVPAAGRTLGQVRISLEEAARRLHNTDIYVSLASVRQIGVLVAGHVAHPGRQNLTVFHTALDALMEAGGVQKTGSLRQIKLIRSGRATVIDLYELLVYGGDGPDLTLRDGDRILVPPVGPTVSITGAVKRPGIYEIRAEMSGMRHRPAETSERLSLNDMLDLAGGVLSPGKNRFMKLEIGGDGRESVREVEDTPFAPLFSDGAILMVSRGGEKRAGTVELSGDTRSPGIYDLEEKATLTALLDGDNVLGPDIYPLIGVVERWDAQLLTTKTLAFSPQLVLAKKFDMRLSDGDSVRLFSKAQIAGLDVQKPRKTADAGSRDEEAEDTIDDPALASFLSEHAVSVRGAVRTAGRYPVADGATLENIIAAAGGLGLEADRAAIEVTSSLQGEGHQSDGRSGTRRITVNLRETPPSSVPVGPGDSVRIGQSVRQIPGRHVLIVGEVKSPGTYDFLPGDHLSDLLARAGGLTPEAYPAGAIFSREAERLAEESRFRAAARDLERSLATAMEKKDGPDAAQVSMARDLAAQLREVEAVGRITIEADPAVLTTRPELDILLESGDRIYIPRRPLTVRVSGEVLSPAALQFRKEKDPRDYIMEAGGFTYNADKGRTFVVYPDGSAQPLSVDAWNHKAVMIPPGSAIVVPRDPKPFDFLETAGQMSQIVANLALTGIWIEDLRDKN